MIVQYDKQWRLLLKGACKQGTSAKGMPKLEATFYNTQVRNGLPLLDRRYLLLALLPLPLSLPPLLLLLPLPLPKCTLLLPAWASQDSPLIPTPAHSRGALSCVMPCPLLFLLQWLDVNTPYSATESQGRQLTRAAGELRSWARNFGIIMLEAMLQLPSVLCLLWYDDSARAGNILFASENHWGDTCRSRVAVYFYIYAGSVLVCQGMGFLLSPLRYLRLAACINVLALLCVLWALYIPQV